MASSGCGPPSIRTLPGIDDPWQRSTLRNSWERDTLPHGDILRAVARTPRCWSACGMLDSRNSAPPHCCGFSVPPRQGRSWNRSVDLVVSLSADTSYRLNDTSSSAQGTSISRKPSWLNPLLVRKPRQTRDQFFVPPFHAIPCAYLATFVFWVMVSPPKEGNKGRVRGLKKVREDLSSEVAVLAEDHAGMLRIGNLAEWLPLHIRGVAVGKVASPPRRGLHTVHQTSPSALSPGKGVVSVQTVGRMLDVVPLPFFTQICNGQGSVIFSQRRT
ncbi:hypothetical protein DFH09DRAFT_1076429 [Mycena vulgaris]|nr:hypothetical protein DFH09DRAFT_1076429 [Mycena vulgaris]